MKDSLNQAKHEPSAPDPSVVDNYEGHSDYCYNCKHFRVAIYKDPCRQCLEAGKFIKWEIK